MSLVRAESSARLVWVVHLPTGSADYGRVEDITHAEDGSQWFVIRVSDSMRDFLQLTDQFIDMRYTHLEFTVHPVIPMPDLLA